VSDIAIDEFLARNPANRVEHSLVFDFVCEFGHQPFSGRVAHASILAPAPG
jgi:hypothetical protein